MHRKNECGLDVASKWRMDRVFDCQRSVKLYKQLIRLFCCLSKVDLLESLPYLVLILVNILYLLKYV